MIFEVFNIIERNQKRSVIIPVQPGSSQQSVEPFVLGGESSYSPDDDIVDYPMDECIIHPERCATREMPERFPDEVGVSSSASGSNCSSAYPTVCIPPAPPDLNCKDVLPHKRFKVLAPDPHKFDGNHNGIGCE